jgi:EF hand domain-containing protein
MKSSRTMIAIAIAALIPMGAAVAGDKDKDKAGYGASFDTLDTNRDGRISQGEASADSTIVFSTADANGDGYLDKSEWKNRAKDPNKPMPQSSPESTSDPAVPQGDQPTSEPTPDTETPRQ